MHQVQHPAIPRDIRGAAEIFEVDEIHVEAARFVLFDHDVGLLQVARVEPGLVQAPDLCGDGVGDLFAAMHVASLDFAGAEHKAAQRVGVDERAADEVGRSNRAGLVHVHRGERFRMREAVRFEHRGAGERSPGARAADSRVDAAAPRRDFDALYERGARAGDVNESCARPGFSLEHAKIRRRHQLVGALDDGAPFGRARIEDYGAHARSSLALSRAAGIGARVRIVRRPLLLGFDDQRASDVRGMQLTREREDARLVGDEGDRLGFAARHDFGDVVRGNRKAVLILPRPAPGS